jgi:hypothetical protein
MKKPIAKYQSPLRRQRTKLVQHRVVRVEAEQHVGKNGIIKNAMEIPEIANWQRTRFAAHGQAVALGNPHESPQERSSGQIVLRRVVRR